MDNDNILRIDADKDALANMLEFELFNHIFSALYSEDDPIFRKLKVCIRIFIEHGIPLKTSLDMLKEMGDELNKIDEEEK